MCVWPLDKLPAGWLHGHISQVNPAKHFGGLPVHLMYSLRRCICHLQRYVQIQSTGEHMRVMQLKMSLIMYSHPVDISIGQFGM